MSTKPTIKKTEPKIGDLGDLYQSAFEIPDEVMNEIKKEGLAYRWINATEFKKSFGFHKNRWMPFKSKHMASLSGSLFGGDPEGYVRRGDLILAVKPKELQDRHRAHIQAKNEAQAPGLITQKRNETMRELAREHGVKRTNVEIEEDEE